MINIQKKGSLAVAVYRRKPYGGLGGGAYPIYMLPLVVPVVALAAAAASAAATAKT